MRKIGITMGDPAGIGPEVLVKLFPHFREDGAYLVYGEEKTLREASELLGAEVYYEKVERAEEVRGAGVYLIDLGLLKEAKPSPSLSSGKAGIAYLARATADAVRGELGGLLTLPISKLWAKRAGFSFPGQTEFLAKASGVREFAMAMYSEPLKVVLLTTHLPLREVGHYIKKEIIKNKAKLAVREWESLFGYRPTLKVLGLNPHAGEGGEVGREEVEEIAPAVRELSEEGFKVEGPLPPDSAFLGAGEEDLFLCMYHDQGLIPFKLLAFEEGVNLTLGLPFVRTSPDHGTAYDIAWKGKASERASLSALRLIEKVLDAGHK